MCHGIQQHRSFKWLEFDAVFFKLISDIQIVKKCYFRVVADMIAGLYSIFIKFVAAIAAVNLVYAYALNEWGTVWN